MVITVVTMMTAVMPFMVIAIIVVVVVMMTDVMTFVVIVVIVMVAAAMMALSVMVARNGIEGIMHCMCRAVASHHGS